jgi:pyruvate kinase
MLHARVDLFRFNYSHQNQAEHERRARQIRAIADEMDTEVGFIVDLQGPKIRLEYFQSGRIVLTEGKYFTLDSTLAMHAGDHERVGITYKQLPDDVKPGDTLLVDDGRIVLEVESISGPRIKCRVRVGGELTNSKGINLLGGGMTARTLTTKDIADLQHGVSIGADYFAISFVRNPEDIEQAKQLITAAGSDAGIIAKIERAEAIDNAEQIIEAADAIMIARGDLGVEIGDAVLPAVQKNLITLARKMDRAVITATQMMQSMINSQIPTRAEVFDVANAVLDGTDAVMLSAETSIGLFPDKVIEAMSRICEEAEKQPVTRVSDHRINQYFARIDEAIAMSTMYCANHIQAKAIASLTETGSTCRWMSRISSAIPVYAFTRNIGTMRKARLYRGVYPIRFDITHTDPLAANREIINILKAKGFVTSGDKVIITKGDMQGLRGGTNNMKIIQVNHEMEDSG